MWRLFKRMFTEQYSFRTQFKYMLLFTLVVSLLMGVGAAIGITNSSKDVRIECRISDGSTTVQTAPALLVKVPNDHSNVLSVERNEGDPEPVAGEWCIVSNASVYSTLTKQ